MIGGRLNGYMIYSPNNVSESFFDKISSNRENETQIKKENENMRTEQILSLWYERKHSNILKHSQVSEEKIKNDDVNYRKYTEHKNAIMEIFEGLMHASMLRMFNDVDKCIPTDESTKIALFKNAEICTNQLDKLRLLKREICAMLSACETYEQEMDILKRYEVVDKDGKINA